MTGVLDHPLNAALDRVQGSPARIFVSCALASVGAAGCAWFAMTHLATWRTRAELRSARRVATIVGWSGWIDQLQSPYRHCGPRRRTPACRRIGRSGGRRRMAFWSVRRSSQGAGHRLDEAGMRWFPSLGHWRSRAELSACRRGWLPHGFANQDVARNEIRWRRLRGPPRRGVRRARRRRGRAGSARVAGCGHGRRSSSWRSLPA